MKKLLVWIVCTLLALPACALATPNDEYIGFARVLKADTNFREGMGEDIIFQLPKDAAVFVLDRETDKEGTVWYKARSCRKGKDRVGYVRGDLLQLSSDFLVDIKDFSISDSKLLALRTDGTVIAIGANNPKALDVSKWTNIVDVAAESFSGMGLTANGNVLTLGNHTVPPSWRSVQRLESGREIYAPFFADGSYDIYFSYDTGVSDEYAKAKFGDIANIAISTFFCIGIKENGIVVTDDSISGQRLEPELSKWQDVVSVGASEEYVVGLKNDGTLYAFKPLDEARDEGQADVEDWADITQIAVSRFQTTVGLKSDGTVLCTNRNIDVSGLLNIAKVECEDSLVVALTNDGRLLFRGDYFFFGSNTAESIVVNAR